jgi:hypothetical protein
MRVPRCGEVAASAPPHATSAYGSCGPATRSHGARVSADEALRQCPPHASVSCLGPASAAGRWRRAAPPPAPPCRGRGAARKGSVFVRADTGYTQPRCNLTALLSLLIGAWARRQSAWRRSYVTCSRSRCACRTASGSASCAAAAMTSSWCAPFAAAWRRMSTPADVAERSKRATSGGRGAWRRWRSERGATCGACGLCGAGGARLRAGLTRRAGAGRRRRGGASGWAQSRGRC